MSDPTDDIDALSAFLLGQPVIGPRWHSALTALVAERDALRKRVAELEALSKPVYISHGQRVESIDLRERLVCAALPVMLEDWNNCAPKDRPDLSWCMQFAVEAADAAIAAMRKGDSDGK